MEGTRKYRPGTIASIILLMWLFFSMMYYNVIKDTKTYINTVYFNETGSEDLEIKSSNKEERKSDVYILKNEAPLTLGSGNNTTSGINTKKNRNKYKDKEKSVYDKTQHIFNDYLIHTSGCKIPDFSKSYKVNETKHMNKKCGERLIFAKRLSENIVSLHINNVKMKKLAKKKTYNCCYQFVTRSTKPGHEDTEINYTSCKNFKSDTEVELEQEIIHVSCVSYDIKLKPHIKKNIYSDVYIFMKKIEKTILNNNTTTQKDRKFWNVLILGMDTMSRSRFHSSMPKVAKYLQKMKWLDQRGYQKIASNTFPNVMSFLTGKKMSTVYKACAKGMHKCNDLMIWSKFKENGYITAYGEDFLRLPDTFSKYNGFKTPPTDHYMRPMFLTGENAEGNLICTKTKPSVTHILDYALQLTNTYKDNPFFGMFWLNSYSHNLDNLPSLFEDEVIEFFENLSRNGVTNNTFVIFLSDHGIRFGLNRIPVESYYEERLPMFFMWTPPNFRTLYTKKYNNTIVNQHRLTNPYDFYYSLWDILKMSNGSDNKVVSEACPQCKSLFDVIPENRTCSDASVDEKWCTCHNLAVANNTEKNTKESTDLAVSRVLNISLSVKTKHCYVCEDFALSSIIRTHFYTDPIRNKTYYIVAFKLSPGDVLYETKVKKSDNKFSILNSIDTISSYNVRGSCVELANDRPFCVCKKINHCK